jgi:hypothetical protein
MTSAVREQGRAAEILVQPGKVCIGVALDLADQLLLLRLLPERSSRFEKTSRDRSEDWGADFSHALTRRRCQRKS